jgi:hypothetical protein
LRVNAIFAKIFHEASKIGGFDFMNNLFFVMGKNQALKLHGIS